MSLEILTRAIVVSVIPDIGFAMKAVWFLLPIVLLIAFLGKSMVSRRALFCLALGFLIMCATHFVLPRLQPIGIVAEQAQRTGHVAFLLGTISSLAALKWKKVVKIQGRC